ncbi:MAG TPA: hypothetical protein VFX25_31030 [Streptosporangiaceae bacterium]|nr:hypothetical protein [Streptosporangiaceae bacterium]
MTAERTVNAAGRLARLGYQPQVSYEPAGRFWALRRAETLIYLAAALMLAGLCPRLIRRRS